MPSPFPGMDPYLEGPRFFADFHDSMIVYMKAALQRSLPQNYFAQSNERIWVETSKRHVVSDVSISKTVAPRRRTDDGGVAVMEPESDTAVVVEYDYDLEEEREIFLDIFEISGSDRQLVTSIEILSPANKTPGREGRGLYRTKQREMLKAEVHFIEIDLLRGGTHSTSVPRELIEQKFGPFDYHVCLHRCDDSRRYRVYPFGLRDALPEILIPLKPKDGYVTLNLQSVFAHCYDECGYAKAIAYGRDPLTPSLTEEQSAWATSICAGSLT